MLHYIPPTIATKKKRKKKKKKKKLEFSKYLCLREKEMSHFCSINKILFEFILKR